MLTGKGLAEFCIGKIGTPYVYGAKGSDGVFTQAKLGWLKENYPNVFTSTYIAKAKAKIGQVCTDCSGLPCWYTKKNMGSSQLYATAFKRGLIATIDKAPVGALLWKQGHIGVYIGNGYCVEAKGIGYGTVKSKVANTKFTHWLLFDYIDYDTNVSTIQDTKQRNPYIEPGETLKIGANGYAVKWVQWELNEAGYDLDVDGRFGPLTQKSVKKFQQSCKIKVDGVVGPVTRKCFKAN